MPMRRRTHRHRSRTCKRLVEAMDGSIESKNSAPRRTRVTARVTLSVAKRQPSWAAHGTRHGVRALLVEDDRVQQVILETLLRKPVAPAILREVVLSAGSRLYR
jgi:hypothetical protein